MKYVDEFRAADLTRVILDEIRRTVTQPWTIMEICGGQTHTIMRHGLDELLPREIEIVHGPGCPVCVTSIDVIDKAIEIAGKPGVILCSYGDMLRVPGSETDLFNVRAGGGDVRIVYSPMDAVRLARQNPERRVVFFAIGFETTAPAHALAVLAAERQGLDNFSVLASHVLVPPALQAILDSPSNRVQGFIAPGHVCTVVGLEQYEELVRRYRVPIVVGGFEPVDILEATRMLVAQLETGRAEVENQYTRSVTRSGNLHAQEAVARVFEVADRGWRGIGTIPRSGLRIRRDFATFDAERLFGLEERRVAEPEECISALVLQGIKKPTDCAAFGRKCSPDRPLGALMVSNEGACSAYYRYKRPVVEAV